VLPRPPLATAPLDSTESPGHGITKTIFLMIWRPPPSPSSNVWPPFIPHWMDFKDAESA
jgi:hypothetical protein